MKLENLDTETLGDMYIGLENNPELANAIEVELENRIAINTNYSREHLFRESIINRHALGIHFIPTTESFNNYGSSITVAVSENENLEALLENYAANPPLNTFGNIRLRVLVENNLSQEQIEAIDNEGIDTSHISHIITV
jgi:hypothetical protein